MKLRYLIQKQKKKLLKYSSSLPENNTEKKFTISSENWNLNGLNFQDCLVTPQEIISKSESRIESIEQEKQTILNDLAEVSAKWKPELTILKEQLEIEKQRSEIFSSFGQTQNTMMLEGWVRRRN